MADTPTIDTLPSIAPLPPSTARQIGSGQVLVDPSSLVKELIDNALDARAKSIFVNITANSIDSIQVRDDGHGIPAEDRVLVCRRYCTSKIRDICDLKEVGGQWLGFRGEALSSMAELSGTLSVTTRVEGEPIAVKLTYGRDGELSMTEPASHPVGTTVKVTHFFNHIPVRKQTATKNSSRCLAKIRRLMQAYALARPAVRFRLHVLKANNNKGDFIYSPKADSSVQDAVLKVIGNDCALQCDWAALESDGFEIHAFLPKPSATGSKIANQGAFISVDSRPVCSTRGTTKQVTIAFKEGLRRSNPSLATIKEPFFCMNIICPPNSYDANIEPAKDDVLFEDFNVVMSAVDRLLKSYYPEAVIETEAEPPTSLPLPQEHGSKDESLSDDAPRSIHEEPPSVLGEQSRFKSRSDQPRWRANMYGIDEDDLVHFETTRPLEGVEEEDEDRHAVEVSNPWTIARINATIKPSISMCNGQLLSPAKSQGEGQMLPSSPAHQKNPSSKSPAEPLTPQLSSEADIFASPMDEGFDHSRGSQITPHERLPSELSPSVMGTSEQTFVVRQPLQNRRLHWSVQSSPASRHSRQMQRSRGDVSSDVLPQIPDDTWFGQPMRGSKNLQPPHRKKRREEQESRLAKDSRSNLQRTILPADDRSIKKHLYSEDNTDIRDFFGIDKPYHTGVSGVGPSFTPANISPGPSKKPGRSLGIFDEGAVLQPANEINQMRDNGGQNRPSSQPSSLGATLFKNGHQLDTNVEIHSIEDQSQDHASILARTAMPRPLSVGSERPLLVPFISNNVESSNVNKNNDVVRDDRRMAAFFKAYQDREGTLPSRRQRPRVTPSHEYATKSRPPQRRLTAGSQRTKSSRLPLERVPHGCHVQNVILHVNLSIACIIQRSYKLDMRRNSPEWSYPTEEVYDTFAEPVSERTIMDWVIEIDAIFARFYEKMPVVDVRCLLHEAIQRGLDERKHDQDMHSQEIIRGSSPVVDGGLHANDMMEDQMMGTDQSQPMDLDAGTNDDAGSKSILAHKNSKQSSDEFGEDIEDDMLLDL